MLHTSRLWRDVVTELGATEYPDVAARPRARRLVRDDDRDRRPRRSTSSLTENTFGDILSDVAAAVTGGLGLAASASLGDDGPGPLRARARLGAADRRAGRREPGRDAPLGRAPAPPRPRAAGDADGLERAVDAALAEAPTPDLGGSATTREVGDAVLRALDVT